jgi:hypothetical protein
MTTPNKARLQLLKQAADPFVLRYHLCEGGSGYLFLSPKDDLESVFYLYPRDNFRIKDLVSQPDKSYLVTTKNIDLLTQTDEELLTAIKTDRQRALDFLKEQAPKDKLFGILSQIDPEIKRYDIDSILRRYSSGIPQPADVPLSLKIVVAYTSKEINKAGHELLKPYKNGRFIDNLKAYLAGVVLLIMSKGISLSVKAAQNAAKKEGLTEAQYIAKHFCEACPKTGTLVASGGITTYGEFYLARMIESK